MRAAGEAVRLSLEPAVLQAPGEVPYGIPQTMEFHVCNSSSVRITAGIYMLKIGIFSCRVPAFSRFISSRATVHTTVEIRTEYAYQPFWNI